MANNPSSAVAKAGPNTGDDTIARLLMRHAAESANDIALRENDRGIWREGTWSAYAEEVLCCAAGFMALGVKPGDAVIILGDNRVRLYAGMTAMSMLRAHAMPAYPGATLDELKHFCEEAHVVAALVEDQEQVDKILDLRDAGTSVASIVYDEVRGLNPYDTLGLQSWVNLLEAGAKKLSVDPDLRLRLIEGSKPDDPAVFMHSSGTTGKPKGIVLSQKNVLSGVRNAYEGGAFDYGEDILGYLPMAWVGDFALTVAAAIAFRFTVNVPERQETVQRDMREVAPSRYPVP